MSYDLYVCTPPLPASDAEAWKLYPTLSEEAEPQPEIFHELIARLAERYPWTFPDEEWDKLVWSISPLTNCIRHRVTELCMTYPSVAEVAPFVVETAISLGLDVFEPQLTWIYRHDGIKGLLLTIENKPPFVAPTLEQLGETIGSLTPYGGPSYVVLQDERDDYVQAAGGNDALTAEWREYSGKSFRHWVAGNLDQPSENDFRILTNGAHIMVKENEQLSASQVTEIIAAYAKRERRPDNFTWRETTEMFR